MRKFVSAGIDWVLPRSSKTDPGVEYAAPVGMGGRPGRRTPNPSFSRRPAGYNDLDPTSHSGFFPDESNSWELCAESRIFVQGISAASLSQLLIWYLYHDLVPYPNGSSHRYDEMHRDLMIGWIRLGYELGCSTTKPKHQHLPEPLQEVIETLGLDARGVYRKLVRLGNEKGMHWHELAMYDLASGSSYLAAGDELQSDYQMLQCLRPISGTCWEKRRTVAMEWIQAYLALVIRPAVDLETHPIYAAQIAERDYDKVEVARSFGKVCTDFVHPPTRAIYHQAIAKIKWAHANDMLKARDAMAQNSGTSWFPSTSGFNTFVRRWQDRASEKNDRRRSAPMLNRQESALLSMQGRMNLMEESVEAALHDRNLGNTRYQQMPQTDERGRSTRAPNHIDVDEYRQSLQAAYQSHDIDDASRYSDDFESSQRRQTYYPSPAERPSTALGYPALPPFAYHPDNPRFQSSQGNEDAHHPGNHDPSKRHGMILGDDYRPLNSHPPPLTECKGKEHGRNDSSSNHPPRPAFPSFGRPRDINPDRTVIRGRRAKRSVVFEDDSDFALRDAQHLVASGVIPSAPTREVESGAAPNVPERSAQRHADGETVVRIVSPTESVETSRSERQSKVVSSAPTPDKSGTSGSGEVTDE